MESNERATPDGSSWFFDREGTLHAPLQSLRLLDAFDTQLTRRADGAGHAVIEPRSGQVLGKGETPRQANASALRTVQLLGRRRLRAALDGGEPIAVAQAPAAASVPAVADSTALGGWQGLYDQAVRKGSGWETLHHNGGAIDKAQATEDYGRLQDRLRSAIADPNTPDEARLPLATAGYQLYVGANAAGVSDPGHIPYAALKAAMGAMAFSGGGAVGPRVLPVPQTRGLLSPGASNRTAVVVGSETPASMAARPPAFRTPGPRPSNRADLHQDLTDKGFSTKTLSDRGYTEYTHSDGRRVTVKPSGEVIPVRPTVSQAGKRYRERTDYDFVRLPDQAHSTGHFVEPFDGEKR